MDPYVLFNMGLAMDKTSLLEGKKKNTWFACALNDKARPREQHMLGEGLFAEALWAKSQMA